MNRLTSILKVIEGASYMNESGLHDYHAARKVRDSLRKANFVERFYAVKNALSSYRVMVTIVDGNKIRIYRPETQTELVFSERAA